MKKYLFILLLVTMSSIVRAQTQKDTTSDWHYYTRTDEMTSYKSFFADIYSEPSSNYNLTANLIIRNSKDGNEILLSIPHGIMNVGVGGIVVNVKFDNGKIEKFSGHTGDSNRFDIIFMNSVSKLIKELKTSQKILLQVELYNKGDEVFHFDTRNLTWDRK